MKQTHFFLSAILVTSLLAVSAQGAKYSGGAGDGYGAAASVPTSMGKAPISLTLATDQIIERSLGTVPCGTITVTDGSPAAITAGNGLRLTIPEKLKQTWDTTVLSPTFGGSAGGSVGSTVSYANNGKTLVITVSGSFSDGAALTIDGLAFTNLIQPSLPEQLTLDINNNGVADAWSDKFVGVTKQRPGGFGDGGASFTMIGNVPFIIPHEAIIVIR